MNHHSRIINYTILTVGMSFVWSCNNKKSTSIRGNSYQTIGANAEDQVAEDLEQFSEVPPENAAAAGGNPGGGIQPVQESVTPGTETQPVNPMTPTDPLVPVLPATPVKVLSLVGVRNFESINSTFSVLTGVPKNTPSIIASFEANKVSLPSDSFAEGLTSSAVVGLYKLSAVYCDELSKSATLRPIVYGTFNFSGLPLAVLNDDGMRNLADVIVTRFWGKNLARLAPHDSNVTQMVTTFRELKTDFSENTAANTIKIVNGACTAALMSTPSLVF